MSKRPERPRWEIRDSVSCPECGAEPGRYCELPGGLTGGNHPARVKAFAEIADTLKAPKQ